MPRDISRFFVIGHLLTLLIALSVAQPATAGIVLRIGEPNRSVPQVSFDQIDHSDFDALLRNYSDKRGQVCYSKWKTHCCDAGRLQTYLHQLGNVDPSLKASQAAKKAYYINAYNALALWGILDSYPVANIQRLDGKRSRYDIFDDLQLWVGDGYLSLNGIENDVLRPMHDLRIHFALVCAARGCPRLRNEAYTANRLDWQLTDNAFEFFSRRERFHISRLTGKVKVSPILKWYREDFGRSDHDVVTAIFPFLPQRDRFWLAAHAGWKLSYLGYDWGLNDRCPTISVVLGRIPVGLYAKVSPLIAPLMPKVNSGSSDGALIFTGNSSRSYETRTEPTRQNPASMPVTLQDGPPRLIPGVGPAFSGSVDEPSFSGDEASEYPPVP